MQASHLPHSFLPYAVYSQTPKCTWSDTQLLCNWRPYSSPWLWWGEQLHCHHVELSYVGLSMFPKKFKRKQPLFWQKTKGPIQPGRQTCCVRKLTCCFHSVCGQMPPAWKGQKSTSLETSHWSHVPLLTDSVKLLKWTSIHHLESSTKQASSTDHRNSCGTSLTSLTHTTTGCTAAACQQPWD